MCSDIEKNRVIIACILGMLYSSKICQSGRHLSGPIEVENLCDLIVGEDHGDIKDIIQMMNDDSEFPLAYADRQETTVWLTSMSDAIEKSQEIRSDIYS